MYGVLQLFEIYCRRQGKRQEHLKQYKQKTFITQLSQHSIIVANVNTNI